MKINMGMIIQEPSLCSRKAHYVLGFWNDSSVQIQSKTVKFRCTSNVWTSGLTWGEWGWGGIYSFKERVFRYLHDTNSFCGIQLTQLKDTFSLLSSIPIIYLLSCFIILLSSFCSWVSWFGTASTLIGLLKTKNGTAKCCKNNRLGGGAVLKNCLF